MGTKESGEDIDIRYNYIYTSIHLSNLPYVDATDPSDM